MVKFTWKADATKTKPAHQFQCNLKCQRCEAKTSSGKQCTRKVCMGLTRCWSHTRSDLHLAVKPSTIPNAGKGLFAIRTKKKGLSPDELKKPIFKTNDKIAPYVAEAVSRQVLDDRYAHYTSPYALSVGEGKNTRLLDAACERGIASFANSKPASSSNAKFTKNGNIVATKNIYDGAEIFANYGREYKFHQNVHVSTK